MAVENSPQGLLIQLASVGGLKVTIGCRHCRTAFDRHNRDRAATAGGEDANASPLAVAHDRSQPPKQCRQNKIRQVAEGLRIVCEMRNEPRCFAAGEK